MAERPTPDELKSLVAELVAIPAISGYEEPMIRWCRDRLAQYSKEVEVDVRGNVFARFPCARSGAPRLMIAAHMDSIGLIVKSIDEKGFVRFVRETLPLTLASRRVRIHGAKGPVNGVIGTRVGYSTSTTEQLTTAVGADKLYIDAGCASAAEAAEAGIGVGAPITFCEPLATLANPNLVMGPYLDDRVGIALLTFLAESLAAERPDVEVFLVATIEEELGLRGAGTAAERLRPDVGISVDTMPAGGTPDYTHHALPLHVGLGPVIKFTENAKATCHPRVRELLRQAALNCGAPHQMVAAPPGGTDMQAIEQSGHGVPSGAIAVPRRYAHTPNEVLDLRDAVAALRVLREAVRILGAGFSLARV